MSLRILIAPDKFKGTLTARAAAEAIARGWRKGRPQDDLTLLPMSDGGDGFGEIISDLIGAKPQKVKTVNAAHQSIKTIWWWDAKNEIAVIESAKIIGLAMLPRGKFHPFDLDTFGLGKVLQAAAKKGARRCIIGIGGSATNDGGFGIARAMGWKFLDVNDKKITSLRNLPALRAVVHPAKNKRLFRELVVAVDVQNKLLGPLGCSRVYGPQKGLRPEDIVVAEAGLCKMSVEVAKIIGRNSAKTPGAGAAGGLGFGLMAFFGGKPQPGFEIFTRCAKLKDRLRETDLVITGEGALDPQSLMGKGTGALALLSRKMRVPCVALCGTVISREKTKKLFTESHGLTDITSLENAIQHPDKFLETLATRAAQSFKAGRVD